MEVTIVQLDPMTIVGWQTKFIHARSADSNGMSVIGNLWRNVFKFDVLKALPGSLGHPTWGVIWGDPVQQRSRIDELNYLAGVPFAGVPALPEGITSRNVPAGSYARITHRGPLPGLPATIEHLYANWLPDSGYEHAGICDLELYDDRFFKEGPDQEFDYFISVKPTAVPAQPAPHVTITAATDKDTEDTGARSRTFNERKKTDALHPSDKPAAKPKKKAKAKKPAKKAAKKALRQPGRKKAVKKKTAKKAPKKKPAKKTARKRAPKKRGRR
jgi:predicted transcriptional regulator YdeE